MGKFSEWRDQYVVWHATKARLPAGTGEVICQKVRFSGRVQKVGFRLELHTLASRLGLVGYVKNLSNGDVEAILQGQASQIAFLMNHMHRLKRARLHKIEVYDLPLIADEYFEIASSS